MSELLDRLTPAPNHQGDPLYAEADIRSHATEVFELCRTNGGYGGLLAVLVDDLIVSVALFDFAEGDIDGKNAQYERVFHGSGPSGNLRELRHTYWGDPKRAGYIYYVDASMIREAFDVLEKWFDLK